MSSDKIPVTYDHEGIKYYGYLTKISGGGSSGLWHLYLPHSVSGAFWIGDLMLTSSGEWRFYNQQNTMGDLADYLGLVLQQWYQ